MKYYINIYYKNSVPLPLEELTSSSSSGNNQLNHNINIYYKNNTNGKNLI